MLMTVVNNIFYKTKSHFNEGPILYLIAPFWTVYLSFTVPGFQEIHQFCLP